MNILVLAAVALLGGIAPALPASGQNLAASYRSDHAGKRYDFQVTHAQIQATPDWPESADSPPLSPRKALVRARRDLAGFLPDAAKWTHPEITLREVGASHKWMYVIQFEGPLPPGVSDGPVDRMRVLVLMDGTAIQPVITRAAPEIK